MVLESVGVSLGLLLAVPFFHLVSVPLGIAFSAALLLLVGLVGLVYFGLRKPKVVLVGSETIKQ
jgi:hypothetical protein